MAHWRLYLGALLFGLVGTGAVLVGWHLYTDHQQHHAIWQVEVQRAQQQQALQAQQQLQAAPPVPK